MCLSRLWQVLHVKCQAGRSKPQAGMELLVHREHPVDIRSSGHTGRQEEVSLRSLIRENLG